MTVSELGADAKGKGSVEMNKKPAGWVFLDNASKRHWFRTDGRSLCGRWLYLGYWVGESITDEDKNNCSACRKIKLKMVPV